MPVFRREALGQHRNSDTQNSSDDDVSHGKTRVLNKAYLPWRDTSPSLKNGARLNRIVGVGDGRVAVVPDLSCLSSTMAGSVRVNVPDAGRNQRARYAERIDNPTRSFTRGLKRYAPLSSGPTGHRKTRIERRRTLKIARREAKSRDYTRARADLRSAFGQLNSLPRSFSRRPACSR
jgi:hypothetical protein